jgi:hypothetical protein
MFSKFDFKCNLYRYGVAALTSAAVEVGLYNLNPRGPIA